LGTEELSGGRGVTKGGLGRGIYYEEPCRSRRERGLRLEGIRTHRRSGDMREARDTQKPRRGAVPIIKKEGGYVYQKEPQKNLSSTHEGRRHTTKEDTQTKGGP